MSEIKISLCIPTNGVVEWIFPVLESIYKQQVDMTKIEVIVTDNGHNEIFKERMQEYIKNHNNLIYKETKSYMFHNQIDALKLASGVYLKFINHRSALLDGALAEMLEFVETHEKTKPVIYFSNGVLGGITQQLTNFNDFVAKLGRHASWTTGVGIWKETFDSIPPNAKIDNISPHSYILFADRKNDSFIINDKPFCYEVDPDDTKKGTYDLYKAFSVEEFLITLNLYADGDIDARTVKAVKKDYQNFVKELYWRYNILHKPCSYKIDGFNDSMDIIFPRRQILVGAYLLVFRKFLNKLRSLFLK